MVGSAEFSGAVLGIRSRASTSAQRSAVALCTQAYRIDHLNIIPPLRRPGPPGLADFAITVEYTPIQLPRHCVVPIEPAARCGCTTPEPHPVVTGRNRPHAAPHLGLLSQ
jgi:hypothetical protein